MQSFIKRVFILYCVYYILINICLARILLFFLSQLGTRKNIVMLIIELKIDTFVTLSVFIIQTSCEIKNLKDITCLSMI